MTRIAVSGTGGIIRQTVAKGQSFEGQLSADAAPQVIDGVIEYAEEPPASGNEFVQAAAVNNPGSNYTVGDILTAVPGTFVTPARIRVDSLGAGDGVDKFTVIDAGEYSITPGNPVAFAGGTGSNATFDLTFAALSSGGFIRPSDFLDRPSAGGISNKKLNVFWIKVLVGAGISWDLFVTDGKGNGTGVGLEVDDPVDDAPIISGTGNAAEQISIELAPSEALRLKTGTVTSTVGLFQVHFIPVTDTTGRPMN